MSKSLRLIAALGTALIATFVAAGASAQDMGPVTRTLFYMAADADGVMQVYQLVLGGEDEARQVTYAETDVMNFGAAPDGLSIAYVSGRQLWLQPLHTEEAEALAPITDIQFFSGPVYSPDAEYIAYTNDGVWLYDLATRETRQLLADVPLDANGTNMGDFRLFDPARFIRGADGEPSRLVVQVGVWEWQTAGIYDLTSSDLTVLESQLYTRALPLYGDKLLLYGNGGVGGEMSLSLVDGTDSFEDRNVVVDFSDVSPYTLFAEKAVEVHPGVVRIYGTVLVPPVDKFTAFYFDANLMEDTVSELTILTLSDDPSINIVAGDISPDGAILPVYTGAQFTPTGSIYGEVSLIDLTTGETLDIDLPETVGVVRWQP